MSDRTRIEADGLGDWRMQAITPLASDVPPAYPGGAAHKTGTLLILTTHASTPKHPNLYFSTPSAPALALDTAFRSASTATALWPQIKFQEVVTPAGNGTTIAMNDTPLLFDFFSGSMAAAGSSFQAIEAFANESIAGLLTGTTTLERKTGPELNAEDIERYVSTEEKIATVIPRLLKTSSIKGGTDWQKFVLLKNIRDAATHFKSGDQYYMHGKIERGSLYQLLLNNDPCQFPLIALRVIWSLRQPTATPRWLTHLAEKHGVVR